MTDIEIDVEHGWIKLTATSATATRSWIKSHYPTVEVSYRGYNSEGELILMGMVREQGNKAPVATAMVNRGGRSTQFTVKVR